MVKGAKIELLVKLLEQYSGQKVNLLEVGAIKANLSTASKIQAYLIARIRKQVGNMNGFKIEQHGSNIVVINTGADSLKALIYVAKDLIKNGFAKEENMRINNKMYMVLIGNKNYKIYLPI